MTPIVGRSSPAGGRARLIPGSEKNRDRVDAARAKSYFGGRLTPIDEERVLEEA
jgi:hypothetical protein